MAGPLETEVIKKQVRASFNAPLTSSFGRLFDGVSALIGLRGEIEYEAQAAIDLEVLASTLEDDEDSYEFELDGDNIRVGPLIREVIGDLQRGVPRAKIAIKFHNGVARLIGEACSKIASDTGLDTVVLSGGCFQNRILLRKSLCSLRERSLKAFIHHQVPCNDGGLSLGQAAIANFLSGGS
jgi:hydrogenase maturation protein HypF